MKNLSSILLILFCAQFTFAQTKEIDSAVSKSLDSFENEISKLDTNITVFVYCASGGRSSEAADMMRKKGFQKIIDLDGGFTAENIIDKVNTFVDAIDKKYKRRNMVQGRTVSQGHSLTDESKVSKRLN